ncbi:DNA gyrase subunit A [Anthocerotibacter panamensis]|uniref:DNA gyrase subunit A n=1 Tax=Anthocerotibacter panamensis TaxID=2857077 RepID=UPI001C407001|nr:DNA gyrase subunit A [Anthocerotibacter panamensis]
MSSAPADRIVTTNLRNEMQRSYLEYAMSVIVGRALPDGRDGLKPVHRRILFTMHELGLSPDRPFRKCARVVGDALGKYHPHGDSALYDALVRMAQDFSMRMPLIEGHGNFGSIDDDPPAAMRYTECRLTQLSAQTLLTDIESDTVDFQDNFDGSQQEPTLLPARLPQLLLNGSSGIAVGMATNIPPHNLGELVSGLVALIDQPDISISQLNEHILGPDFPTAGVVLGRQGIRDAYRSGRGSITIRGKAEIETITRSSGVERQAVVITELPYQVSSQSLELKISELVNDGRLEGISDLRNESDRTGVRIVVELKRDAYPRVVLNNLYKLTPLQVNFGVTLLALVGGRPKVMTIKEALEVFLNFRIEVIERRTRYELNKVRDRDHILQGQLIALQHLDAVIAVVRQATDVPTAKVELMARYELSETQADSILRMQLRSLTSMEADRLVTEHEGLQIKILDLEDILARRPRVLELIKEELLDLKTRFTSPRRTIIETAEGELEDIDLIANQELIVLFTEQGYVKGMPCNTFNIQKRATRGKSGGKVKEDDQVQHFFSCSSHDTVLFFTNLGTVFALKGYQLPMGSRTTRGVPIVQLLPIPSEAKITSMLAVQDFNRTDEYLVMLTRQGYIKKTDLKSFAHIRTNGLIAIDLEEGDELRWVRLANEQSDILVGTAGGMAIRFHCDSEQLRPLGRTARGVRAMRLKNGHDCLVGMDILPWGQEAEGDLSEVSESTDPPELESEEVPVNQGVPCVLVITRNGLGKRVPADKFRAQNRGGQGVKAITLHQKGDQMQSLRVITPGDEIMLVTNRGIVIRQSSDEIPLRSRNAQGIKVQRLDEEDAIVGVTIVAESVDLSTEENSGGL